MDRSELQDAFSKTLDTKPRHSYVNHIKQQLQEEEKNDKRLNGSTVNRLSRAFETNTFERPALPAKPPTLRPPSTQLQPSQPPKPPQPPKPRQPPKPPQTLNFQQILKLQLNAHAPEIDETQPTFKDLRAKFQQENSIPIQDLSHQNNYRPPIPLKPSKTGPISSPEKLIRAAKTGPPALPVKPKMNSHRYMDPLNHQLPPLRQYQTLTPLETHDAPQASSLNIPSSSINSIPSLLPHTATDNSSIHSTTSTSSQASTLNSSKRGWHLSSWFSSQQQRPQQHEQLKNSIRRPDSNNSSTGNQEEYDTSKPISPQLTAETNQTMSEKRIKVIQELIVTEKSYQKDMNLLKDIYYDGASKSDLFSKSDMRHLFSNLLDIVEFERTFVALLETSCEHDSVGSSFREMMHDIDSIYSEYCKRHEDAVLKLQELEVRPKIEAFLKVN
ncbi:MAG: hypothetical protein EXX96DRAFT_298356 [Benjaminiella poitrasii]|nr:MAG: hypothetical protein EXX96DRAFT_298356 [Benjaminiella poitrasii]